MIKFREPGLVSIVVTNYNNENYIKECLNSLVKQSYKNLEIIIVDDCSTDNSVFVINDWIENEGKLLKENKRVELIKSSRNMGFAGAVTMGLYLAKGEYIAMQDGDDYSNEFRIEKQINYLKQNNKIKVVGSNYSVFTNERKNPKEIPNFLKYGVKEIKELYANGGNAVSYGTLLFRGGLFDIIGGLNRRIDGAEDYEYITRLLPYGVDNIKESLYYYRLHDKQRSREFYGEIGNKKRKKEKEDLSVMLVLDNFNIGGTETHVLTLAKELIKKGVKITIVGGTGELEFQFKNLKCNLYNVDFPIVIERNDFKKEILKDKIKKIIEKENINVVHAHQSPSGVIVMEVANELNIPSVFTIHGMYYQDIVSDKLLTCNSVISVSEPVYDWLLAFGVQSKVIPNGINYEEFNVGSNLIENIRKFYGIEDNAIVAMYCSRMAWGKIKTCENLIKVCRDLKRGENIEIHALVVGDGPGYNELKELGENANRLIGKELIHFTGNQLNLPRFYGASNYVVGTGRVAIEAMASKKPVIATGNNGYFGPIKEKNLKEAWKVYFGDHSSAFTNNAMYLYDDLKDLYLNREKLEGDTDKLFDKSKDLFDINNVANKIIEVYLNSFK